MAKNTVLLKDCNGEKLDSSEIAFLSTMEILFNDGKSFLHRKTSLLPEDIYEEIKFDIIRWFRYHILSIKRTVKKYIDGKDSKLRRFMAIFDKNIIAEQYWAISFLEMDDPLSLSLTQIEDLIRPHIRRMLRNSIKNACSWMNVNGKGVCYLLLENGEQVTSPFLQELMIEED